MKKFDVEITETLQRKASVFLFGIVVGKPCGLAV